MEQMTGIYLELLFLDGVLNFGQGVFVFLIFGIDTRFFVAIAKRFESFSSFSSPPL